MGLFDWFGKKEIATDDGGSQEKRNWDTIKQLRAIPYLNDAGVRVDSSTATQVSAYAACIKVISEDIAALPLFVYQRNDAGDRTVAREHAAYKLLHDYPNDYHSSNVFRKLLTRWVLLHGNAYAYITKKAGVPVRLQPIHPNIVFPKINKQGNLYYEIKVEEGKSEEVSPEYIFHLMGNSEDGIKGINPVEQAARQIGISLAADKMAASLYKNNASLGGIVIHPGKLSPEAEKRLVDSWRDTYTGADNANQTAFLQEGMSYQALGIPPEQAQFLQSRRFQIEEIARLFRMPPHKIQDLSRATFSNIEHLGIDYVQSTLLNWLIAWEQEINRKLFKFSEQDTYYAEHKVDALLRGDTTARYSAHATAIQWGWTTAKRVAQLENLPTEGLSDAPITPLNMSPVSDSKPEEDKPQDQEQKSLLPLVKDAASRLLTKEQKAYQRAIKKFNEKELDDWAFNFYAKHRETINSTYSPLINCFVAPEFRQLTLNKIIAIHDTSSALRDRGADIKNYVDEIAQQVVEEINAKRN